MGLDTVELLIAVETYFNIRIANKDAEQITTVDSMANTVANYLGVTNTDSALFTDVFSRLCNAIGAKETLHPDTLIAQYLPIATTEKWQQMGQQMNLLLPKPVLTKRYNNKISNSILSLLGSNAMKPNYNWESITVEQFITAVCACNYQVLLQPSAITTKYEIYIAVVGITADIAGIDYFEISPEKWFTSDLGMD